MATFVATHTIFIPRYFDCCNVPYCVTSLAHCGGSVSTHHGQVGMEHGTTNTSDLQVSASVRIAETQDGAVLLDLRQGICFGMTPVGIKIWHLLKEELSVEQIADRLATEYVSVSREQIVDDLGQYVTELRLRGLLIVDEPVSRAGLVEKALVFAESHRSIVRPLSRSKAKVRHLLFWKALLGLLAFDLLGFGNNFWKSYCLVRQWRVASSRPETKAIENICKTVDYACVWYPKRVLCLQRSVITTCLLRHCGVPAQMAIGAQKFPFKAHAWTEVDGRPINERRDVHCLYMIWERC